MSQAVLNRASDIKAKYMSMGNWKSSIIKKKGRGNSEHTKLARTYTATLPLEGWKGGMPEQNGYKG